MRQYDLVLVVEILLDQVFDTGWRTDIVHPDKLIALTNAKADLHDALTAVALHCAVIFFPALAIRISHFISVALGIDDSITVS